MTRRTWAAWLWLRGLMTRGRADRELQAELESHLQMHEDDNLKAGMTRDEARRQALVRLGGVSGVREQAREVRAGSTIEHAWHDLRQGARLLWRSPRFTILAVLILALGVGAVTTMFALVNAVVLRPLPVANPHELVWVRNPSFSYPVLREIRERQQIFSGVFGWSLEDFDVKWGGETETTSALVVTGAFYSTLGVQPVLGRAITEEDEGHGGLGQPVALISHGTWMRRFGGDPRVLGQRIVIGKQPFTIVGVTPRGFFGIAIGVSPEVTIPATAQPLVEGDGPEVLSSVSSSWLHIVGRLRPGIDLDKAQAGFQTIWPQVLEATARPGQPQERRARYLATRASLAPGATGFSRVRNRFEEPLWLLFGLVSVLLLVACGAVAHLLFARGSVRQREFAVRLAVGAGRRRLASQLFIEGLLLAGVASLAGLTVAVWTSGLLVRMLSTAEDRIALEVGLDWRVYAFTVGVAAVIAVIFTLVPALRAARLDPGPILKAHARALDGGARGWRTGQVLVVSQMACSLVLVAGAALFLRSLDALLSIDAGFDRNNLLVVRADASREPAAGVDYYRTLREAVAAVPGVTSASISMQPPIHDGAWTQHLGVDGAPPDDNGPEVYFNAISPGYFATMRTPVVSGRDLRWTDERETTAVVAVNQTLARMFFGDANPLGRRLTMGRNANRRVMEIVAVVADAKYGYLQEPTRPVAYLPYLQAPGASGDSLYAIVRTAVPPPGVTGPLRQVIRTIEPESPIVIETVTERIRDSLVRQRLLALVAAFLGQFALLLGCGALYGLMSHIVARRTNEIGIRIALGAERREVMWMVMRDSLRLAAIGSVIGLALVAWLGKWAQGLLFTITATDPVSLTAATLTLIGVAAIAGYVPARRAAHADPVAALRAD